MPQAIGALYTSICNSARDVLLYYFIKIVTKLVENGFVHNVTFLDQYIFNSDIFTASLAPW